MIENYHVDLHTGYICSAMHLLLVVFSFAVLFFEEEQVIYESQLDSSLIPPLCDLSTLPFSESPLEQQDYISAAVDRIPSPISTLPLD